MKFSSFYERYWQHGDNPPADHGFDIPARKARLQATLNTIPPIGTLLLDAGCGNGEFSAFLSELGYSVVSTDISANAVKRARQRFPAGCFGVASLEDGLPFPNSTFAAIWSSEVLEHLFDVHTALSECNRILQPGGLLVLTTPHHGLINNLIIALTGLDHHYNPYLSHIRFFTRRTLSRCLERAGFVVDRYTGVGRFFPIWRSCFVVARKVRPPEPPPAIEG